MKCAWQRFALWPALIVAAHAANPAIDVRTNDGLALRGDREGRVTALELDGHPVPLGREPWLFRVRDAVVGGNFVPAKPAPSESPLALRLTALITNRDDFLQIDGEVATQTPVDRCIDLKISLPIDAKDFVAHPGLFDGPAAADRPNAKKKKSLAARAAASLEPEIDEANAEDNAWYPLVPASNRARGAGLTLAVPPTHPTRFATGHDDTGLFIVLRIGLSPAAATPGRTPYRVILYRHDPAWGFRSALARYYASYREPFFTRHAKRIGAWTTQNASQLAHPRLYAYHEAGFPTWRHPAGTGSGVNVKLTLEHLDEGPVADSLEDYERLCELALDEQHGIYSLPYTIVGQRQLLQLPALPRDHEEAMRALDAWQPKENILFDGPPQATSFRSADELKTIIRDSTLHDEQHRLALMPRAYRGPTLTFPQNPNPNLFRGDAAKPTIASYTLDYYLPLMLESKFVDGLYLDSLGRWCGFYNFRTEHFKYSTVPLTYSGSPPQPCLWNLQSHAEYMWEAGQRLHARGKILMANGIGPERVMLGFACDVLGRDGAPASVLSEDFYALRVAAGVKPYCLLNATHRTSPRLWNAALYLGFLVGCNDPKGLADEARYLPLIIQCNEAGWEPITHARASPVVVGVERWGGQAADAPLYFTVMNRSTEPVDSALTIDLAALKQRPDVRAEPRLGKSLVASEPAPGQLTLRLHLAAEQTEVIAIK